jgi:hypothetical protein
LDEVWYLSVATVWLQACVSYLLVRQQFRRRLDVPPHSGPAVAVAEG